jgi:predicted ATP-dependent serine protease
MHCRLVVIDGDPSVGKSSMMFDLAARISTGRAFPLVETRTPEQLAAAAASIGTENSQPAAAPDPAAILREYFNIVRPPRRVLYAALEDPINEIAIPRMKAAGANMANIAIMGGVDESGPDGQEELELQLPRDLELIADRCRELQPELIVIDPLFAVLGLDENNNYIKANDDQSVRRVTSRLKKLAEECQVTIVLLRHLNKTSGRSAMQRAPAPSPSPARPAR